LSESSQPSAGSDFVITRLMELTFVKILRGVVPETGREHRGLLAGSNDPVNSSRAVSMVDVPQ
jgi:hypothetical protein